MGRNENLWVVGSIPGISFTRARTKRWHQTVPLDAPAVADVCAMPPDLMPSRQERVLLVFRREG